MSGSTTPPRPNHLPIAPAGAKAPPAQAHGLPSMGVRGWPVDLAGQFTRTSDTKMVQGLCEDPGEGHGEGLFSPVHGLRPRSGFRPGLVGLTAPEQRAWGSAPDPGIYRIGATRRTERAPTPAEAARADGPKTTNPGGVGTKPPRRFFLTGRRASLDIPGDLWVKVRPCRPGSPGPLGSLFSARFSGLTRHIPGWSLVGRTQSGWVRLFDGASLLSRTASGLQEGLTTGSAGFRWPGRLGSLAGAYNSRPGREVRPVRTKEDGQCAVSR